VTEKWRAVIIVACIVAGVVLSYKLFLAPWLPQFEAVRDIQNENSTWMVTLQCYYARGAVSGETFRLANDNGKSSLFYSATSRNGLITKQFTVPLAGPEGTFLFEQLRADGLWDIDDKPARPNPKDEYVIAVQQTLGDEGGSRAFSFTDPEYWATTKSVEYKVGMPSRSDPSAPIDISAGVPRKDPRYLTLVREIRAFGPPNVIAAESRIREELAVIHPSHVLRGGR
jgi:hypothetical protein